MAWATICLAAVRDEAGGDSGETRHGIGGAFNGAQHRGGQSENCQESGEDDGSGFAAEVTQRARQSSAQDRSIEPARTGRSCSRRARAWFTWP
jgi:hypothetical protein